MENKYNWDLTEIFENDEALENSISELYSLIGKIKQFKGKLANNVDEMFNCFKTLEKALELQEKIYAYAMFKYHQDMSNQDAIKLYKRIETLTTEFSEAESFMSPEISKISDEQLEEYLKDDRMKEYEKMVRDIMKEKKHILSEEVEQVLAKYSEIFSSSENTYDIFTNTEFEYPSIVDEEGFEHKMSSAMFSQYLMSKSESIRKQAFESMYSLYKKHINTITELYLSRVKQKVISSKLRNYESSLDAATNHDDSNVKVYETLLKELNKNLYLNHEYIKLKAKLLNKEQVHMYDVYVNTLDVEDTKIEYEDAKQTVLEALAPMGEEYVNTLKHAFENNWLDVYTNDNKMSGAYSMGVHTLHPFVLLNYINSSRDVSTIAHELGHSMHSFYASKNQNIINANYTIMVAEVASTVNEILLANYLINKENDNKKKMALINEQLDMIRSTLIRQSMFAEFEKDVHGKIEAGESLTSDNLNDIYFELVKKYFGESCIIDEPIKYEWARIPHFYRCFYVYKYATGITSAIVIASKILAGEPGYVEKYINMLSQGGAKDSLTLLRMVDVDLEKEETYDEAFRYFEKNLNELKKLIEA
ncbi:MAG: oligoendopeptidase F [Clostridia bacterium]|nr:oligoendopeptidase F [Clostridia bacterium]